MKDVNEHFVFEDVRERAAEDNAFVLHYLKPCYDMEECIVDIHVYVTEHEEKVETGQVKDSPMAKRLYVDRDSAKHVLSVKFMSPYGTPKFCSDKFYYTGMRETTDTL